jgi:hypothetical protein
MRLYELTGQFSALDSMDLESEDDIQAFGDLYKNLEGDLKQKITAACQVVRNREAEVDAIKTEVDRLNAKKKLAENRINWLKGYMQYNLEQIGLDKVETDLFVVRIQNNQPSVNVTIDPEELPEVYRKITIDANKRMIGDALKSGEKINGCELSRTKSLRIK